MREKEDNIIGYIEYLSDDGKIIGYVTPFTDVDKFRKEILKAAEVGMPITPVVFPDGQQNSKPPAQRTMPHSPMQNTPSRISARMRG